jgi:DNA-binding helix-hairpin-helix protein with protein kinase domain
LAAIAHYCDQYLNVDVLASEVATGILAHESYAVVATQGLCDHHGRPVDLDAPLAGGKGGEGEVYSVRGDASRVAKIFVTAGGTRDKAEKLRWLVNNCFPDVQTFAAWPQAILFDSKDGSVAGYTMRRFSGKLAFYLTNPTYRLEHFPNADWGFLLAVAEQCASAFQAVHARDLVIGDVNQKNVMVAPGGRVCLIDCDSFQIRLSGTTLRCTVGVPEFTPPELQDEDFSQTNRSQNHDRFGLAVLIFQLLFGRHPFAGVPLPGHTIPQDPGGAIQQYLFAYGRQSSRRGVKPPSAMLPLSEIASALEGLFELAFRPGSEAPAARPSAGQWLDALRIFRRQLRSCADNPSHKYSADCQECSWCRIRAEAKIDYFEGVGVVVSTTFGIDSTILEQLWGNILQVPHLSFRLPDEFLRTGLTLVDRPPQRFQEHAFAPVVMPVIPMSSVDAPRPDDDIDRREPTPLPTALEAAHEHKLLAGTAAAGCLLLAAGGFLVKPLALIGIPGTLVFTIWLVVLIVRNKRQWAVECQARVGRLRQAELYLRNAEASRGTLVGAYQKSCRQEESRHQQLFGMGHCELARLNEEWRTILRRYHAEYEAEQSRREAGLRELRSRMRSASAGWQQWDSWYRQQSAELRKSLHGLRMEYESLDQQYRDERDLLARDTERLCRNSFLKNELIAVHDIRGIGPNRKAQLAWNGIVSAYDIDADRIMAIQSFGPALTEILVTWRRYVEASYRFSQLAGIPDDELRRLARKYARREDSLRTHLRDGVRKLHEINDEANRNLTGWESQLRQLWHELTNQYTTDTKVLASLTQHAADRMRALEAQGEQIFKHLEASAKVANEAFDQRLKTLRQHLTPLDARIRQLGARLAQAEADVKLLRQRLGGAYLVRQLLQ